MDSKNHRWETISQYEHTLAITKNGPLILTDQGGIKTLVIGTNLLIHCLNNKLIF